MFKDTVMLELVKTLIRYVNPKGTRCVCEILCHLWSRPGSQGPSQMVLQVFNQNIDKAKVTWKFRYKGTLETDIHKESFDQEHKK